MAIKNIELDPNNNSFFITLVKNNYNDPVFSSVREIVINGIDSTIQAKSNRKVEITLENTYLKVRDFGVGMSSLDIEQIFGVLFKSKKKNDKNTTGSYGIGSKAPLAYCTSFSLKSYKDGICNEVVIVNINGNMSYDIVKQEKTNEPNGVEVLLPVNENFPYSSFYNYIFFPNIDKISLNIVDKNIEDHLVHNHRCDYVKTNDYIHSVKDTGTLKLVEQKSYISNNPETLFVKYKNTIVATNIKLEDGIVFGRYFDANDGNTIVYFDLDYYLNTNTEIKEEFEMNTGREQLLESSLLRNIIREVFTNFGQELNRKYTINYIDFINNSDNLFKSFNSHLESFCNKEYTNFNNNLPVVVKKIIRHNIDHMIFNQIKLDIKNTKNYDQDMKDSLLKKLTYNINSYDIKVDSDTLKKCVDNLIKIHRLSNLRPIPRTMKHVYDEVYKQVCKESTFNPILLDSSYIKNNILHIAIRDITQIKRYIEKEENRDYQFLSNKIFKNKDEFIEHYSEIKDYPEHFNIVNISELPYDKKKYSKSKKVTKIDDIDTTKLVKGVKIYGKQTSFNEIIHNARERGIKHKNIIFIDHFTVKCFNYPDCNITINPREFDNKIHFEYSSDNVNISKDIEDLLIVKYTGYNLTKVNKEYIKKFFTYYENSSDFYNKLEKDIKHEIDEEYEFISDFNIIPLLNSIFVNSYASPFRNYEYIRYLFKDNKLINKCNSRFNIRNSLNRFIQSNKEHENKIYYGTLDQDELDIISEILNNDFFKEFSNLFESNFTEASYLYENLSDKNLVKLRDDFSKLINRYTKQLDVINDYVELQEIT